MNPKKIIASITIILFVPLIAVWVYPRIEEFYKVDRCLDSGGSWNYDLEKCDFESTNTISIKNTDIESIPNINRPSKSSILSSEIDTANLFKVWVEFPNSPHADFYIDKREFFVVDYDGNSTMPYRLEKNTLTIYYNDAIRIGEILSLDTESLIIKWQDGIEIKYSEWKN